MTLILIFPSFPKKADEDGFIMSFKHKACATPSMRAWQTLACGYPCGSVREGKERERKLSRRERISK
jgi:hypothetical protein